MVTTPPPLFERFLDLPTEVRLIIYRFHLQDPGHITTPRAIKGFLRPKRNFSLLLTCRRIYNEFRQIPAKFYSLGCSYDPCSLYFLRQRLYPWQIAALKKLDLFHLCPSDLNHFLWAGKTPETTNLALFNEPALNLDNLTIYTHDWLSVAEASYWRGFARPEDVQHNIPRSSKWLVEMCRRTGFRQLDLFFNFQDLAFEYWEAGGFLQSLFQQFRKGIAHGVRKAEEHWTIWHQQFRVADRFVETVTVLHASSLHGHSSPCWSSTDIPALAKGTSCARAGRTYDMKALFQNSRPDIMFKYDRIRGLLESPAEEEIPALHVEEICGYPGIQWRSNHCRNCEPEYCWRMKCVPFD